MQQIQNPGARPHFHSPAPPLTPLPEALLGRAEQLQPCSSAPATLGGYTREESVGAVQSLPAGRAHTQAPVAAAVLLTAGVTNLGAARIINLPSSSVPATPFFSEPSGPDKSVWWWQCSQPPLSLDPSPWMRASYSNKSVTTGKRLQKPCGCNHPCEPFPRLSFSTGSHLVLQVHGYMSAVWLPVHGIAMENMDHGSGIAWKNKSSCSCTAQLKHPSILFPEKKVFPHTSPDIQRCQGTFTARLGCAMSKYKAHKVMYLSQQRVYSVVLTEKVLCKWKISVQRQEICSKKRNFAKDVWKLKTSVLCSSQRPSWKQSG